MFKINCSTYSAPLTTSSGEPHPVTILASEKLANVSEPKGTLSESLQRRLYQMRELPQLEKDLSEAFIDIMEKCFRKPCHNGGVWYPDDYRLFLKDEFDAEMIPSFETGYASEDFFEKTGDFTFKLKPGKRPSDAIRSCLESLMIGDCGNALVICGYEAIRRVVGDDKFNQVFDAQQLGLTITQNGMMNRGTSLYKLAEFTELAQSKEKGVIGKRPLNLGDACHFQGVIFYSNKFPLGFAGGWNVVYVGDNDEGLQLFMAHGFEKPLTEKEIYQKFITMYNQDRGPQDEAFALKNPDLYDRRINPCLKDHFTLSTDLEDSLPFIGGFKLEATQRLNATLILELKRQTARDFLDDLPFAKILYAPISKKVSEPMGDESLWMA